MSSRIRCSLFCLSFLAIAAVSCGDGTGASSTGAGGAVGAGSSSSSGCPGPGTSKTGEPCTEGCECECKACGVFTKDGVMNMICVAGCEPTDGGTE